jgi:hypothetical protein
MYRQLRQLEAENRQLRQISAALERDVSMLRGLLNRPPRELPAAVIAKPARSSHPV